MSSNQSRAVTWCLSCWLFLRKDNLYPELFNPDFPVQDISVYHKNLSFEEKVGQLDDRGPPNVSAYLVNSVYEQYLKILL